MSSDKLTLPLSIIAAGALIGTGIYYNGKIAKENPSITQQAEQRQKAVSENLKGIIRPIDSNDHVLGSPKARVLVVEYSDTECPFCKMFHSTMLSIMKEYGQEGDVAWVYRHFPIAQLHDRAFKEAVAQECAAALGGNGKFWEYTNELYEITPSNNQLDPSKLTEIAVNVGLFSSEFNACLDSGEFAPRVQLDIDNAREIGIAGTPHSIIIDTETNEYYTLEGAYPYAQVKQAIDLILSQ